MSVNPKTLVEKFIKDSKGRSRLAAATSVLAVFTVLITVGVLTFPAISVSGSEEALREQGIDITVGQTAETEEVVAPPADEAPIVAYEEASEAPEATQAENVAEAITEESQIGEVADVPAEASEAAIAEGDEEAIDTEGEEGEEEAEEEDPEKQEAEAEVEASDAAKQALEAADLSSQRLIIGTADANALAEETSVVANFDNVYLLQFENETEAAKGFLKYFDAADFVTPDVAVEVAEDDTDPEEEVITTDNVYTEDENPFAELEAAIEDAEEEIAAEATKQDALIAVIDTGAATSENVVEAISVLGEDGADDNGHGQRMVDYVLEQNEDARILSIKALGKDGKGDVSAVIAGINYAIERGANIINLSMSAYASEENAALADAVQRATEAGILVVGAAGNNGFNAKYYIPGNIEEALVVGAADETGTRIAGSNFGLSVDYNVVSAATSEAAARMSGFVSANTIAGIDEVLNQGLIYTTDYNAADAELLEEEAEEEVNEVAEEAQESEEETPEAFEGVVAQGVTSQKNATSKREWLIAQCVDTQLDGGKVTYTKVKTWDALEWAINNAKAGQEVTIELGEDLAAYKTLNISGKNIKITNPGGYTIYADSDPTDGMTSFFNVESTGDLTLDGVTLDGRSVVTDVKDVRVNVTPEQYVVADSFATTYTSMPASTDSDGTHLMPVVNGSRVYIDSSGKLTYTAEGNTPLWLYKGWEEAPDFANDTNIHEDAAVFIGYWVSDGVYKLLDRSGNFVEKKSAEWPQNDVNYCWYPGVIKNRTTNDGVPFNQTNNVWLNKYSGDKALGQAGGAPTVVSTLDTKHTTSTDIEIGTPSGNQNTYFITSAGDVILKDATLQNAKNSSENTAPVIVNGGTFTMSGNSTISDNEFNSDTGSAGAIINNGGTVEISNGVIRYNHGRAAGAILNKSGELKITGGEIKDHTRNPGRDNWAPIVVDGGKLEMSGGTISDNAGKAKGSVEYDEQKSSTHEKENGEPGTSGFTGTAGAIRVNGGSVEISGDALISENKGDAGAIWVKAGTLTMNGGIISNNKGYDGTIRIGESEVDVDSAAAEFYFNGGKIQDNTTIYWGNVTVKKDGMMMMGRGTSLVSSDPPTITGNKTLSKGGAIYVNSNHVYLVRGEIANNTAAWMGGGVYVSGDSVANLSILTMGTDYGNDNKPIAGTNGLVPAYIYENNAQPLSDVSYNSGAYWPWSGIGGGIWYCAWSTVLYDQNRVIIDSNHVNNNTYGVDVHKMAGSGMIAEWKHTRENDEVGLVTNWATKDASNPLFGDEVSDTPYYKGIALENTANPGTEGALPNTSTLSPATGLLIHHNQAELGGGLGLNGIITFRELPVYKKTSAAELNLTKMWKDDSGERELDITNVADKDVLSNRKVELTVTFQKRESSVTEPRIIQTNTFMLGNGENVNDVDGTQGGIKVTDWAATIVLPNDVVQIDPEQVDSNGNPIWSSAKTIYEEILGNDQRKVFTFDKGKYDLGNGYEIVVEETVYIKEASQSWPAEPTDAASQEAYDAAMASYKKSSGDYTMTFSDLVFEQSGPDATDRKDTYNQVRIYTTKGFTMASTISNDYEPNGPTIKVHKADDSGNPLAGAKFRLYKESGTGSNVVKNYAVGDPATGAITSWTTNEYDTDILVAVSDANGNLMFSGFKSGTYFVEEIEAPIGYELSVNNPVKVIVTRDGVTKYEDTVVTNRGVVTVDDGQLFVGGHRVKVSDGHVEFLQNLAGESVNTVDKGTVYLIGDNKTKESWYMWGKNVPLSYRYYDENGGSQHHNAVAGDDAGQLMRWIGDVIEGQPVLYNSYTGKYLIYDETIGNFNLVDRTEVVQGITSVDFVNSEKTYPASLLKTDEAGTPLQGATFRLYYVDGETKMYATKDADGKVDRDGWTDTLPADSETDNTLWVTPANGKLVFDNLTPGTYSVEEVSAPSGYSKSDEPVTFVIHGDGVVRYANGSFENSGAATVGSDGALSINKVRVRNTDNTRDLFLQTLTGEKATSIVAGEIYLISEYADQGGRGPATTWYVRAYSDGKLNFEAGKDNYTNGPMGSSGAYFRWKAEELEGSIVLRNVATGAYLVQTSNGFIHVARANVLQGVSEITVQNTEDLYSLKLFKTNGNNEALAGATFRLYYKDNNVKMYAANNNGEFTKWENSPVDSTIWTVPSSGILEFGSLNGGRTYYIEEVSAPEGYNKYEGTISVSISRDGAKTYNGAISDVTVDSETGQLMIAGQRLYAQPGADGTISQGAAVSTTASAYPLIVVERESQEIHNANPTATVVKQLAADTIYAIHIGDTGFYLQGQDSDFASPLANNSGLWTSGYAWKYEVLSDGTKALRNLYGITDTSRYYYLYLENGQIKQTKNAANLLVKNAAGLVVEGDGDTFDIQVDNTPKIPQLILYKTDKNGTKLSGARFYIRELGTGTTKGSKLAYLDEVTTGVYTFNFADAKGSYNPTSYSPTKKYVIREETAPADYVAAGLDIVFTIDRNGVINLITEKSEVGDLAEVNADTSTYFTTNSNKIAINVKNDQKGEVKIEKRNTNNEAVSGAVLQILDANKNPVVIDETKTGSERTQWTTDGSAKTIKLPAGKYYLHEVSAPAPYQCAADMEFTLSSSNVGNDCISLVMYDPKPGEIIITKVDHQGQGLAGAVLQILNAQKKPVTIDPTKTGDAATQWISNGKSYTIPVTLEPGTYYIHEVSAPEGYVAAADQEFVVKDSTGSATTAFDSTARCTVSISNSSIPRITITSDGVSHTGFCLAETVKNINSYSATPVSIDNLPADVPNRTSIDRNKDKIAKILWLGSTNDKAGLFSYYANRVAKDNVRGGSTGAFTDESFTEDDFRIATQAAVWYYTGGKNPASRSDLTNVQMAAALALLRIVEGSSITYIETGESDSPRNSFDTQLREIISKTYTYPSNMKLNVYYSGNAQPVIDPCFPGGSDGANIDRTVVNVPKTVDIEILKKWYDENGNDITAANPQYKGEQFTEVTVTLKRTTEGVENSEFTQELKVTKAASDNASITIDGLEYQIEDTAWGLTIKGLPYAVNINKEVKKYNYSITETVVDGFTTENASPNAVRVEGSGTLEGTYTFTLENKVTTPRYELDLVKVDTRDLPAIQTAIGSITVNNQAAIDAIKEKAKAGKGLLSNDVTFVLIDNNVNPSVEIGMDVEDGVIKFKDLKPGMYRLRETVQPKGYQPNTTIWYIQIEANGEVKMSSREPANDTLDTSVAEGIVQVGNTGLIAVGNEITTYVLPSTGGIGTQVFAVIGALLMLVAGALFVRRTGRQNA